MIFFLVCTDQKSSFSFFFSKNNYIYFSPVKSLRHKANNTTNDIDVSFYLFIYLVVSRERSNIT